MTNNKLEKFYKVNYAMDIQKKSSDSQSEVVFDAETKEIVQNFINKKEAAAAEVGKTAEYFFRNFDVEKTAILKSWFENGTELKELIEHDCYIYTDGKHKLELPRNCVYQSSCINHASNEIAFFDKFKNNYYRCKLEEYKKGDEVAALQAFMNNKKLKNINNKKLTEEEKIEKTEQAQQKAAFLGLKQLRGTVKQKNWAVTIRSDVLEKLSASVAEDLLKIKHANSAKFWIENRFKKVEDFEFFVNNFDKKQNDLYFLQQWKLK